MTAIKTESPNDYGKMGGLRIQNLTLTKICIAGIDPEYSICRTGLFQHPPWVRHLEILMTHLSIERSTLATLLMSYMTTNEENIAKTTA
jgi:hypothetical protein